MRMATPATSLVETPAYFQAGREILFGILTEPTSDPLGVAAVLVHGGNLGPSPGRNQVGVRLCRRLAEQGYHAFRFDYHGVGESTGIVDQFRLDRPFTEDAEAAIAWLRGNGIDRFVLIGGCFGSRTALACVPTVPGIVGLVLQALPVRDKRKDGTGVQAFVPNRTLWGYTKRALRPPVFRGLVLRDTRRAYVRTLAAAWRARSSLPRAKDSQTVPRWISPAILSGLREAIRRRVRILVVSGTKDPGFEDFEQALSGTLGELIDHAGSLAEVRVLSGRVGAAADVSLQQPVIDLVVDWLSATNAKKRI